MKKETVAEFLARGGRIERTSKVLGEKKTFSANYRAGSGKTRMGKNGSGKARMSEAYTSIHHLI